MIRNSSYDVKIICCLMGTSMTIFFPVSYSLIQVYFSLHTSVFYSSDFTRSKRKRKRKLVLELGGVGKYALTLQSTLLKDKGMI